MLKLDNPLGYMFVLFLLFFALANIFVSDGAAISDSSKIILTVTSFVFGFYINNLITQARNRHNKVVESLREEGGNIKAIYFILKSSYPAKQVTASRNLIDAYLVAGMDYKVFDFAKSSPEFNALYTYFMNLNHQSRQQEAGWNLIIKIMSDISKNRNRIETMVKERVSAFEWLTVCTLLALVIYFVYTLNTGTIVSIIITSCVATSLTMLLVILHRLDSMRWKEDKWFWEPLEELFRSLDLLPYYPRILIDTGRVKLKKGEPVRLAEYKYPYPDFRDKKIKITD